MNEINTKYLLEKYPKIFIQHSLSPQKTAMCWLFECGDGWFWLIKHLCAQLQWDIDRNEYPQIEATQVKEKFGSLRFYVNNSNNEQSAMITLSERLSEFICEDCGSTDNVTQTRGYIRSLCKKCQNLKSFA